MAILFPTTLSSIFSPHIQPQCWHHTGCIYLEPVKHKCFQGNRNPAVALRRQEGKAAKTRGGGSELTLPPPDACRLEVAVQK